MHTIFSFGLATGKYAMGSSEPLGTPPLTLPEDAGTQESELVVSDGAPEKQRKRSDLADDEIVALTHMIPVVVDVTHAIQD
jgi:hypothetical protein